MSKLAASVAVGIALGATACATLSGIQQSPPVLTLGSTATPEKASACVVTEVTQAGEDVSVLRPPWEAPTAVRDEGGGYRIVLQTTGGSALAEVKVLPAQTGSVIDVRTRPWDAQPAFLEAVQKCGKPR